MILTIGILVGATAFTGIVLGWFACSLYSRRILLCACGHAPGQGDRYTGICLGRRREATYTKGRRFWAMVPCGCHLHGDHLVKAAIQDGSAALWQAIGNGALRDHVAGETAS